MGKALALHMDVDCLVFTGSTNVAKQLMIYAGQSNMKRVWLEAGGKSPNIVFADAPDLKKAAAEAASAIAFNQGEVCTAGSRLLVENSIRAEFVRLICEALKTWRPGHPLDPSKSDLNVGRFPGSRVIASVTPSRIGCSVPVAALRKGRACVRHSPLTVAGTAAALGHKPRTAFPFTPV